MASSSGNVLPCPERDCGTSDHRIPCFSTNEVFLGKSAILLLTLLLAAPLLSQTPSDFADRLSKNRYQIAIENGKLTGSGLPVLKTATDDAQFVMVGEDHGIAQIPALYTGAMRASRPRRIPHDGDRDRTAGGSRTRTVGAAR